MIRFFSTYLKLIHREIPPVKVPLANSASWQLRPFFNKGAW